MIDFFNNLFHLGKFSFLCVFLLFPLFFFSSLNVFLALNCTPVSHPLVSSVYAHRWPDVPKRKRKNSQCSVKSMSGKNPSFQPNIPHSVLSKQSRRPGLMGLDDDHSTALKTGLSGFFL